MCEKPKTNAFLKTPTWTIARFIKFILAIAILCLFASGGLAYLLQQNECQYTGISTSSHWSIKNSLQLTKLLWERTLLVGDSLVASSKDSAIFFRGASLDRCVKGNRVIALDSATGDVKWDFSAQLVRSIASYTDGYIFSECCTSLTKIDNNGEEIWHSDPVAERTYKPALEITPDKVYLFADSLAYEFSLADGKLIRTLPPGRVKVVFEGITVQVVANVMYVSSANKPDALWQARLPSTEEDSDIGVHIVDNSLIFSNLNKVTSYNLSSGQIQWEIAQNALGLPVFSDDFLFTYNAANKIQIYDIRSGKLSDEIVLQHDKESLVNSNLSNRQVYLALNTDTLFILHKDIRTLIAIKLNLANMTATTMP